MVAAEPIKWVWDINKENCFKTNDIEIFKIIVKNIDYWVRADRSDGTIFILGIFSKREDAENYIDNFIKDNL